MGKVIKIFHQITDLALQPLATRMRRKLWLFFLAAHITMRGGSGIQLNNIAFNGSRIIYEMSFQDLMVAYSGYGGTLPHA